MLAAGRVTFHAVVEIGDLRVFSCDPRRFVLVTAVASVCLEFIGDLVAGRALDRPVLPAVVQREGVLESGPRKGGRRVALGALGAVASLVFLRHRRLGMA